jgi:hypothetical protein
VGGVSAYITGVPATAKQPDGDPAVRQRTRRPIELSLDGGLTLGNLVLHARDLVGDDDGRRFEVVIESVLDRPGECRVGGGLERT